MEFVLVVGMRDLHSPLTINTIDDMSVIFEFLQASFLRRWCSADRGYQRLHSAAQVSARIYVCSGII